MNTSVGFLVVFCCIDCGVMTVIFPYCDFVLVQCANFQLMQDVFADMRARVNLEKSPQLLCLKLKVKVIEALAELDSYAVIIAKMRAIRSHIMQPEFSDAWTGNTYTKTEIL